MRLAPSSTSSSLLLLQLQHYLCKKGRMQCAKKEDPDQPSGIRTFPFRRCILQSFYDFVKDNGGPNQNAQNLKQILAYVVYICHK